MSEMKTKKQINDDFKFAQSAEEHMVLKELVESGIVTPSTRPQDAKAMRPEFAKIKPDKFRAQFNKLKQLAGTNTREGKRQKGADASRSLDTHKNVCPVFMCMVEAAKHEREQTRNNEDDLPPTMMEEAPDPEGLASAPKERGNWIPQCLQGTCEDTEGIQHAALIIALTGGTASSDTSMIEVACANNGHSILVAEEWCDEMTDMDLFYQSVEKREEETDDDMHCRRFAMIKAVRNKQRENNFGAIRSVFHSKLPFQADPTTLRQEIFGNEDGSRFLHIDLTEKKRIKIKAAKMMTKAKDASEKKRLKLSSF